MVFTNVYNRRSAVNCKDDYRDTLVKYGATIGANATIVCGTTTGMHALIAAGAVVNRDVKAYAMMGMEAGWSSPEGLSDRLKNDIKRWQAVAEKIGFTAQS